MASYAQLLEAGLRSATVVEWTRAGHLHRIHRGVYAVGHPNLTREGRWMAAVLAAGRGAVASHGTGARVTGLDRSRGVGTIHLSLPPGRKSAPSGIIVHRPRSLEPIDLIAKNRIPTTTATRTLFDQAALLGPGALRDQFERAEYLEDLDRARLAVLLDGASGRKGLGYLRELACFQPIPLSETKSGLERIILGMCRTHGLPIPLVNVPVLDYEVDFFWPDARLIVEADGGRHRGRQRDRDNSRDIDLQLAGHLVRRYSGEALKDERGVSAEIRAILVRRLGFRR